MNNAARVEAYKSYYYSAVELYNSGDVGGARDKFLKAIQVAQEIINTTDNVSIHDHYQQCIKDIATFIDRCCSGKKPVEPGAATSGEKSIDKNDVSFKPVDTTIDGMRITFDDVAGLKEVKDEIIFHVVKPLENPDLAKIYRVNPGAKIILYGPPGTGKTFVAKAIASELDAVFYSINCSDLVSKYMGDSSKRVEILFEEAQKNERAAIFFDEFDSLAGKRDEGDGSLDKERNNIVSTFLTNIDGFKKSKTCKMLLLIAATNRPWAIDSAMMRGGRFSTKIYVGLPDHEARMFLLKKEFKDIPMEANIRLEDLSALLDGYGCGDIVDICDKIRNLAYRRAIAQNSISNVCARDVKEVLEKSFPSCSEDDLRKFDLFRSGRFNK